MSEMTEVQDLYMEPLQVASTIQVSLNMKENLGEDAKFKIFGGIKCCFRQINQFTFRENFSTGNQGVFAGFASSEQIRGHEFER